MSLIGEALQRARHEASLREAAESGAPAVPFLPSRSGRRFTPGLATAIVAGIAAGVALAGTFVYFTGRSGSRADGAVAELTPATPADANPAGPKTAEVAAEPAARPPSPPAAAGPGGGEVAATSSAAAGPGVGGAAATPSAGEARPARNTATSVPPAGDLGQAATASRERQPVTSPDGGPATAVPAAAGEPGSRPSTPATDRAAATERRAPTGGGSPVERSASATVSPRETSEPADDDLPRVVVAPPHRPDGDDSPPAAPVSYHRSVLLPDGTRVELGGIAWSETGPFALLNGRVMGPGEAIGDFVITSIDPKHVELSNGTETILLLLH